MIELNVSKEHLEKIENFQKDEVTASSLYAYIAKGLKDEKNKEIMLKMSYEEKAHSLIWKQYTKKDINYLILMAKNGVDGVYTADPKVDPSAEFISGIYLPKKGSRVSIIFYSFNFRWVINI